MKKQFKNIIIYSLLLVFVTVSCGDDVREVIENENTQLEESQYNVTINGVEYYRVIPFSEKSENIVYATTKKDDSLKSFTYILNTESNNIVGEIYVFDNGGDYFNNGVARFRKKDKVGLINKLGKVVLKPTYDEVWPINNGYARVGNNCEKFVNDEHTTTTCKKYGLIDSLGNELLPVIYDDIHLGKLSISLDSNRKRKPSDINYHLILNDEEGKECVDQDFMIFSPTSSMNDSLNELEKPYGTFYGNNGVLKVYHITNNNKDKEIYIQFKNKECGIIYTKMALIEKGYTKRYAIFSDNFSAIEINSITPGLDLNDNSREYCQNSWGIYYKNKSKLTIKDL
jgi:hypothetical protein